MLKQGFRYLWVVWVALLLCFPALAQEGESMAPPSSEQKLPGVSFAQGVTEITGVAISPLLGVSAVGAWKYWKTEPGMRQQLPWYCHPWAWGVGAAILLLCFLKDTLGTTVPGPLKKPFDYVELLENKLSALVASTAFVPLLASQMAMHFKSPEASVPTAAVGHMAMMEVNLGWLLVPAMIVAFLAVWLCSHAINVLITLSPFSSLDAVLKLMRAGVLASLGLIYWIAPWLAAAICVLMVVAAIFLAPAAFRLMLFGGRYAHDVLLPWRARKRRAMEAPHVFTCGGVAGLPSRTGGRLVRLEDGRMVIRYRRFLLLGERTVSLPDGIHQVERGVLYPSLSYRAPESVEYRRVLVFLPRYRGTEEEISAGLNLAGVRDHAWKRGFRAAKEWLLETVRGFRRSGQTSAGVE